jgi:hypothetical protein
MKEWTASVVIDDVIYDVISDVAEADPSTGMEEEVYPNKVFVQGSRFDISEHLSESTHDHILIKLM